MGCYRRPKSTRCRSSLFFFNRALLQTLADLEGKPFEADKLVKQDFGRCEKEDCGGFTFGSTIDAERHLRHDHGLGTKEAIAPKGYLCAVQQQGAPCGLRFDTKKLLADHKKTAKHYQTRKQGATEEVPAGQDEEADDVNEEAEGNEV